MNSEWSFFIEDLVAVCKKHGAVIFPRKDYYKRMYVSVRIGDTWLDFSVISAEGAERGIHTNESD